MKDLSALAADAAWVTSQEGGNMVHDNSPAMTAPGSSPSTPVPSQETQVNPSVTASARLPVGTSASRRVKGTFAPSSDTWQEAGGG